MKRYRYSVQKNRAEINQKRFSSNREDLLPVNFVNCLAEANVECQPSGNHLCCTIAIAKIELISAISPPL